MNEQKSAAIVIPIYKQELSKVEILSLQRCILILKLHRIIFVGPKNLDTTVYELACSENTPFQIIRFDNHYFENIDGYNQLMLSPAFYRAFFNFKFILIYQLDAYVFADDLSYWCEQNYDYIGAPHIAHGNGKNEIQFLKGYQKLLHLLNSLLKTHYKISNVGNGGFSLRKTKKCYFLVMLLNKQVRQWGKHNEDGFFKYWGNLLYPFFKLPPDETALRFAIESNPSESLRKLNGKMPFGCHAFEKHEPSIWKDHIEY